LGFTSSTAKELAEIIKNALPGNWYAHSYGGVAFTEAIRVLAKEGGVPSGQAVIFLVGANNHWVTNGIMRNAGVTVIGYHQSWFDAIPDIAGFNSLNPLQWAVDAAVSWSLFTRFSPHTYPPVE